MVLISRPFQLFLICNSQILASTTACLMKPIGKGRSASLVPSSVTMEAFSKKKPGTDSVKMLEDRWQRPVFLKITVTPLHQAG